MSYSGLCPRLMLRRKRSNLHRTFKSFDEIPISMIDSIASVHSDDRLMETLLDTSVRSIMIAPNAFLDPSQLDAVIPSEELQGFSDLILKFVSDFPILSTLRICRDMLPIVYNRFGSSGSLKIMRYLAISFTDKANRLFNVPNTSWMDWAVYHLLRALPTGSETEIGEFVNFVQDGGASQLGMKCFERLAICFLFEGSKALVRVAIAFLAFPNIRSDTDALFRKAFSLRISRGSYPLSARKTKGLRKRFSEFKQTYKCGILHVPVIDCMLDLKLILPVILEAIDLPVLSLSLRSVLKTIDSQNDGFGGLTFTNSMDSSPFLLLLIARTREEPVPIMLAICNDNAVILRNLKSLSRVYRVDSDPTRRLRRIGDWYVFVSSEDSEEIMAITTELTHVSVPAFSFDDSLTSYQVVEIN